MKTNYKIILVTGIILFAMFAIPYSSTIIPWEFYFECLQHGGIPNGIRGRVTSCHPLDVKTAIDSMNKNTIENQKCAVLFNKILQKMKDDMQHCKDLGIECEPLSVEDVLMTDPEFSENACADTVNDWAYMSENEKVVWESGIDWKRLASRN